MMLPTSSGSRGWSFVSYVVMRLMDGMMPEV